VSAPKRRELDPIHRPRELGTRAVTVKPDGLERAVWYESSLEGVSVEQLREACARYAARKTTVPGSYAHRHFVETGHAFGFGCCLGTEGAPEAEPPPPAAA